MSDKKTGSELIVDERRRQIEEEGHSLENDGVWVYGQLSQAAAVYASEQSLFVKSSMPGGGVSFEPAWPWQTNWYKPKSRIRNLVRAGALIAAEIDRLQALDGE